MPIKTFHHFDYVKIVLEANYYVSAVLLIALAIAPYAGKEGFFLINTEIYGPLGNNLQFIAVYLALMEFLLWVYCFLKRNFFNVAILGLFQLLIPSSLQMYGDVNDLPIDSTLDGLFWYTGLSHIAFGIITVMKRRIGE